MRLPLRTIRSKLLTLVGLPVVLLCVALPLLSATMHRELIEEADDRLVDAERSFQTELDDDLAALTLAVRVLGTDPASHRALAASDGPAAMALADDFASVYPRVDILFVDATGRVVADVGPTRAPARLDEIAELRALPVDRETHAIVEHGCAPADAHAPPARVIAAPAGTAGWIVACEPLDRAYVVNAASKLGLELCLLDGGQGTVLSAATPRFPQASIAGASSDPSLFDRDGVTWAIARVRPRLVDGHRGATLALITAMDVSDIRSIVRRHLFYALGMLLVVSLVSVVAGARVAGVMGRSLRQLVEAFRRLERQEYVRVSLPDTRDELESLAVGYNQMVDGLIERDKLRATFGKYMTASVMQHLLSGKVQLGGETLTVTILFSDIRSFTSISERMEAHALVALLNEYFTEMVSIVIAHDGVVDKYIGDAIMAVFGAPVPGPHDARNAVLAAVEMRKSLARLNERLIARGAPALRTGIGIHTGVVVAGNIGSEQRMEYTVIGDAVNLASRLESNTKELGVHILVSADTLAAAQDAVETRPVREITVKGREQPVMTYEITGRKGEPPLEAEPGDRGIA